MLMVTKLKCEYLENPIGIDVRQPKFSWIIQSDETNVLQQGYRIQVSLSSDDFDKTIWDSGVKNSDNSTNVYYEGQELLECTRYYYRVMVSDNKGNSSGWSDAAFFETGLLDATNWKADFITSKALNESDDASVPLLRKEFSNKKEVKSARLYVTSLGLYEISINGKRVGDSYLTPGWTSYKKRLQYQTYDVSTYLEDGTNVIGAMLGCGWFGGNLAWENSRKLYGDKTALLAQLKINYTDGSEKLVLTDTSWKSSTSPITMSEIYHGEIYDARMEMPGWDKCGYDDSDWKSVYNFTWDKGVIVAQENEPIRKINILKPVSLIKTPLGETVIDMGQNMVGWINFKVSGPKGSKVVLKHAEILDSEGNFYIENLRAAKQTIEYILKGQGEETYEPRFTFQGFRYIKVEEYPGEVNLDNFTGIVLHSDMEEIGSFSCSNELVNQLQHNILWGLKGNFVDVPTDCPQRDERLGWTGDAQAFCATSSYLMNNALFFKKWLKDLKADQLENGGVPFVIPHILKETDHSSSGWGDAAVICPWNVYLSFGDVSVLEEQYESMKAWVEYIKGNSQEGLIWNTGFHFGDWLGLDAKEGSYFGATATDLVSTAFYAYSTELLAKTAKVLGKIEDLEIYNELHKSIVKAYQNEFFTPSGRLSVPTQTGYVLSLMFGLVEEKHIKRTIDSLVKLIEDNKWHLTTGFLGTPYLNHVLSNNGRLDAAYKLLLQTNFPSWLYPVTKGATTIWEHWDGLKPDGSLWSKDMNSFNHYAYGAIGEWLYKVVAGINPVEDAPGYKHTILKPQPGGELTHAEASINTMYGKLSIAWQINGDEFKVNVVIPHNTTAELHLPGSGQVKLLGSGTYEFLEQINSI